LKKLKNKHMKTTYLSMSIIRKPQIVKVFLLVFLAAISLQSCKKEDNDDNNNTSSIAENAMYFKTLYENLSTISEVADSDWQIKAIATTPGGQNVVGFFRFDEKPTAAGDFDVVSAHSDITSDKCFVMVNYVNWSGSGDISQSYLANTATNTKKVTVSIDGGKVHAVVEGIDLTGNANGDVATGVKMNFIEQ
jgi:hypothetical protein